MAQDFARSKNYNHRKGGLIGLAAAAIGLMPDVDKYLNLLIPPVLECFEDPESRVCYYACESMYNIAKVARNNMLTYFNQIFDGLCKLFAHVDIDVKNGANLLDRLVKDIVTDSETFDVESFIPLLQKHITRTKPYIRQLLVSWISVLDAVPDINLLDYLPEFLDGLLNMLSDRNKEIMQAAGNVLNDFLSGIKSSDVIEFGPMVSILVVQCRAKDNVIRSTSLAWLGEFILLAGTKLLLFYSDMLGSVMFCISDADNEIKQQAKTINQRLLSLVSTTDEPFDLSPLLQTLTYELVSDHVSSRVAALNWINMLHEKDAKELNKSFEHLLPALLRALSDHSDEVVLINLQVIARICLDEAQFSRVLNALVILLQDDKLLLETRGALIIRKLCALLDSKSIYVSIATILNDKADLEFSSVMVQTLNLILMTAPELAPLRKALRETFRNNSADVETFVILFKSWCHNPVATFSLCLLAQAYDLSSSLIMKFAEIDVTVGFLMQIDKLVQLIESPIFIHLRLELLEVNSKPHEDLLKSLYGLLMLLPQSQAYKTLSDRLTTVSSLQMYVKGNSNPSMFSSLGQGTSDSQSVLYAELLKRFEEVLEQHSIFRSKILSKSSLVAANSNGNINNDNDSEGNGLSGGVSSGGYIT